MRQNTGMNLKNIKARSVGLSYRPDIDGLRAIAVLAVVIFHAFPSAFPGGFVGVDIFFVISGYLIGSILLLQLSEGRFSFRDFYARRIKRIFPALLLVLIASYVFGWFNLIDTEYKELGKHIAAGAGFVSNFALWNEAGYFDLSAETKPLLHLWSLAVEEQFYAFWPLMLWAFQRWRINSLFAIVCIGVASFVLNIAIAHSNATADFYSPFTRFWELMIGCGLAYRHIGKHSVSSEHADAFGWIGAILIGFSFMLFRGQQGYPGWAALLPTIGACLLIVAGPDGPINRRILKTRLLVWIGLISFPLYLWHWPLLAFARLQTGEIPAWPVRLLAVFASFILAWITYRLVELPIRFGKRNAWTIAMLVLAMSAIGLQGSNTYRRDGLDFRLSHMAAQFAGGQQSTGEGWRIHSCFLQTSDSIDMFVPSCTDSGTRPLVFLWGDSHSTELYPGLRNLQSQYDFRIAEYGAADCAPFFGTDARNERCAAIHQNLLAKIQKERPDLLMIGGNWGAGDAAKIGDTVAALRQAGITRLVIVGPTPLWNELLPKIYWLYWRKFHEILPERTFFGLNAGMAEIDQQMQAAAKRLGVPYISAYQALCNQAGCETRTGPGHGQILMTDHGHLSISGSIALMQTIGPGLLGNLSPVNIRRSGFKLHGSRSMP
ncbi:MAG: acyltransferase 3 [Herbaspirillum sp.]|nr:acyltransferase 3 [Herbaspirillum sp.]